MKNIAKLINIVKKYRPISVYIIFLIILFFLYPVIRQLGVAGKISAISYYVEFLQQFSIFILSFIGQPTLLDDLMQQGLLYIDTQFLALWHTFIFTIGIVTLDQNVFKKIYLFFIGIVFIIFFNTIRIIFFSLSLSDQINISTTLINGFLMLFLNFALFLFLIYWFKRNKSFKSVLIKKLHIPSKDIRKIFINIQRVILLLIVVNFFVYTQIFPVISVVSKGVLFLSYLFLKFLGYTVYIYERFIYSTEVSLIFSDTCAGIDLMLIYASFIAILNGRFKIAFIFGGIIIIFLMNVLRVSFLMVYLIQNSGKYDLSINIHDLYTYPVYFITFILWVTWIHIFNKPISIKN